LILLDENIRSDQRELLRAWRASIDQIGYSVGRWGMQDDEIIPLLRRLRQPTFFTRDAHFYERNLRHARYCLVHLVVERQEVASFVRRFLSHPSFRTHAQRLGSVIRVSAARVSAWLPRARREVLIRWPS